MHSVRLGISLFTYRHIPFFAPLLFVQVQRSVDRFSLYVPVGLRAGRWLAFMGLELLKRLAG
jgi:hypothetical protein